MLMRPASFTRINEPGGFVESILAAHLARLAVILRIAIAAARHTVSRIPA